MIPIVNILNESRSCLSSAGLAQSPSDPQGILSTPPGNHADLALPKNKGYFTVPKALAWLDADQHARQSYIKSVNDDPQGLVNKAEIARMQPFIILHLGCLGVLLTGWSPVAVWTCVALYVIRMFVITGFLHRYFSHRTFQTHRWLQFAMGLLCLTCVQRGPLWWAAHHRHHHRQSDEPKDVHSPKQHGLIWSHIGWITTSRNMPTDYSVVKDLAKFPELVFLNRFDWIGSWLLAFGLIGAGMALHRWMPQLGVTGPQLLVWGFFVSTTLLFHGTSSINSLSHVWGSQRYPSGDTSRNNPVLALITLGEGWHNNHHRYAGTVRQGFFWWEFDITFYILTVMTWLGLVWDMHPVPKEAYLKQNML
jgi:stearoyl-CoA desaturase (Delta-9 desaturase)